MRPRRSTWVASTTSIAGAGIRQHAEMRHVPVVADAVVGAVLAHRRDDDAVRKRQIGKFYRREQSARHRCSHLVGFGDANQKRGADGRVQRAFCVRFRSVDNASRARNLVSPKRGRHAGRGTRGRRRRIASVRRRFVALQRQCRRSPPIGRARAILCAFRRETRLRCNSAASARCRTIRGNAPADARPVRAIGARYCRTDRIAVPTWRSNQKREIRKRP